MKELLHNVMLYLKKDILYFGVSVKKVWLINLKSVDCLISFPLMICAILYRFLVVTKLINYLDYLTN